MKIYYIVFLEEIEAGKQCIKTTTIDEYPFKWLARQKEHTIIILNFFEVDPDKLD